MIATAIRGLHREIVLSGIRLSGRSNLGSKAAHYEPDDSVPPLKWPRYVATEVAQRGTGCHRGVGGYARIQILPLMPAPVTGGILPIALGWPTRFLRGSASVSGVASSAGRIICADASVTCIANWPAMPSSAASFVPACENVRRCLCRHRHRAPAPLTVAARH